MARSRMVTRTVEQNIFTVMTVQNGKDVCTETITLGNVSGLSDDKIKGAVSKKCTGLFVQITDRQKVEKLFGMTEEKFLMYAEELPER